MARAALRLALAAASLQCATGARAGGHHKVRQSSLHDDNFGIFEPDQVVQDSNGDALPAYVWKDSIGRSSLEDDDSEEPTGLVNTTLEILLGVGGGTGATGRTGDARLNRELLRRMRCQDKAVLLLLVLVYIGALLFTASLAYRQASNDDPVTYYADPRYHSASVEGHDVGAFLDAFNQPPEDVQLQVTGLIPLRPLPDFMVEAGVEWLGSRYATAFSFSLDLSPWVKREAPAAVAGGHEPAEAGVPAEELQGLRDFLQHNSNDLAVVKVCKHVVWRDWEELATNIKQQIRQGGFSGAIIVRQTIPEAVTVYKNRTWANFMHCRTTKVLCALSVFGWMFYQPYMWLRQRETEINTRFRVDVSISSYWLLIADKVGPDGFVPGGAAPFSPLSGSLARY